MAAARAVAVLGGPVSAARLLKVKDERHQTVQSWLRNRVPAEYCPAIEQATRDKGSVVRCEELRPDVQWDVLRCCASATPASPGPSPCPEPEAKAA